jgi:hypothetical protein
LVASLIKSESDFRVNPNHGLKGVEGQSGIYTTMHPDNPFNARTSKGNIYSCVWILNQCNSQADGNTLIALKYYKGYSNLGESRARHVVKTMTEIF